MYDYQNLIKNEKYQTTIKIKNTQKASWCKQVNYFHFLVNSDHLLIAYFQKWSIFLANSNSSPTPSLPLPSSPLPSPPSNFKRPPREKSCLRGFRPNKNQTSLLSNALCGTVDVQADLGLFCSPASKSEFLTTTRPIWYCYIFCISIITTLDRQQSKTLCISKIVRNRAFDCHLLPDWWQMTIKNTVYSDFWSVFAISNNCHLYGVITPHTWISVCKRLMLVSFLSVFFLWKNIHQLAYHSH